MDSVTKVTSKHTPTQAKIIAAKSANPSLTTREIAKLSNCTHANVIRCLRKYGLTANTIQDYKIARADLMAGVQERILSTITPDDIKQSTMLQRLTGYAILYDKERLERGLSTANASIQVGLSNTLQASIDALVRRVPDTIEASECAIVAQQDQETVSTAK